MTQDQGVKDAGEDNTQRLLALAYTRLFFLPEREDGSKLTTVACFVPYEVRMTVMPMFGTDAVRPFWIELLDGDAGRVVDSAGCWDLQAAAETPGAFIAEAMRLSRIARTPSQ